MSDPTLVTKIKEGQRASQEWKQAWWEYCDAYGQGKKDPAVHPAEFLQHFIATHSYLDPSNPAAATALPGPLPAVAPAAPGAAGDHQSLVAQVKQVQRSSPQGKESWANWCIQYGEGKRDPTHHDASFLQQFLAMNGLTTPGVVGMGMQPQMLMQPQAQMPQTMGAGPVKESLVTQIKELQRSSPEMKQSWQDYCSQYGQGYKDPMRHDVGFLHQFMTLHKPPAIKRSWQPDAAVPMVAGVYAGQGMGSVTQSTQEGLVRQIKDGQRMSDDWKAAWWAWCDAHGEGKRDPSRHPVAFLQEFINTQTSDDRVLKRQRIG
mmetsp:Transcript_37094/g.60882  ORF Transcript_37094/g.60882 Transcript_37094/m.60882 type:complete len:318 (+) Transcript_37094:24-977(+)